MLGAGVDLLSAARLAETMRVTRPALGVVLVRRRLDTSVLSDALRAGVREVVEERDVAGVARAVLRVEDVARQIREQMGGGDASPSAKPEGRVVSVFSAKGGCGKTTLASNLAAVLADRGRREVCLVDLDLAFGDVAIVLQLFPTHTIADAVSMQASLDFPGAACAADAAQRGPDHARRTPGTRRRRVGACDLGRPDPATAQVALRLRGGRHPARIRRPRARRAGRHRHRGAHRDAGHPGDQEPQAHPRDARAAQLPQGSTAHRDQPGRLQGGPVDARGREDVADLDVVPDSRRPGTCQRRSTEVCRSSSTIPSIRSARRFARSPNGRSSGPAVQRPAS